MAQNADLIRIEKATRSLFTGEVLKKGQDGWCLNTDAPSRGIEKVHRKLGSGEYVFLQSVTEEEKTAWNSRATLEQVNAEIESSFTLPFRFSREGFLNAQYTGGNCDIPYTDFNEDRATLNHTGRGVRATVACRITAVTLQFSYSAGDVICYIKKNGTVQNIGAVTAALKFATFFLSNYTCAVGDEILIGFNGPSGRYEYPTSTAFTRQL